MDVMAPDRRKAISWTNAGLLLIGPLGRNRSEILSEILTFLFKKIRLKLPSAEAGMVANAVRMINTLRLERNGLTGNNFLKKSFILIKIYKVSSKMAHGFNGEPAIIGSDIGWGHRRQNITWTNDDPVNWRIYASSSPSQLAVKRFRVRLRFGCFHSRCYGLTLAFNLFIR